MGSDSNGANHVCKHVQDNMELNTNQFAGTSMVLVIPLVWIRRQRAQAIRETLSRGFSSSSTSEPNFLHIRLKHEPASAPPPTFTAAAAVRFARGIRHSEPEQQQTLLHLSRPPPQLSSSSSSQSSSEPPESSSEFSAPGPKELISAISRVDYSTAVFAGKAFGIATCIVTLSGVILTLGIKTAMGVRDMDEFTERARAAIWTYLPGLASRIYRLPETEDERAILDHADFSSSSSSISSTDSDSAANDHAHAAWDASQSEKRLQVAYDKGGMPLFARTAMRELETEFRHENAKRQEKKVV